MLVKMGGMGVGGTEERFKEQDYMTRSIIFKTICLLTMWRMDCSGHNRIRETR